MRVTPIPSRSKGIGAPSGTSVTRVASRNAPAPKRRFPDTFSSVFIERREFPERAPRPRHARLEPNLQCKPQTLTSMTPHPKFTERRWSTRSTRTASVSTNSNRRTTSSRTSPPHPQPTHAGKLRRSPQGTGRTSSRRLRPAACCWRPIPRKAGGGTPSSSS